MSPQPLVAHFCLLLFVFAKTICVVIGAISHLRYSFFSVYFCRFFFLLFFARVENSSWSVCQLWSLIYYLPLKHGCFACFSCAPPCLASERFWPVIPLLSLLAPEKKVFFACLLYKSFLMHPALIGQIASACFTILHLIYVPNSFNSTLLLHLSKPVFSCLFYYVIQNFCHSLI